MAKVSNVFKLVPKSIEDITVDWCNEVLHEGNCLIKVSSISIHRLTNDSSDISDGGGLSGSTMLKVKLTYR